MGKSFAAFYLTGDRACSTALLLFLPLLELHTQPQGKQHSCCVSTLTCKMFCLSASEDVAPIAQQEPLLTEISPLALLSQDAKEKISWATTKSKKQGCHAPVLGDVLRNRHTVMSVTGNKQRSRELCLTSSNKMRNLRGRRTWLRVVEQKFVPLTLRLQHTASSAPCHGDEARLTPQEFAQKAPATGLAPTHQSQAGGSSAALM